jgi:hypothetical protein
MSDTVSVWIVLLVAVIAANLPFFSRKAMGLVPVAGRKSLGWRLAELGLCYLLTGGLGLLLERRAGQVAPQGWEFYAITVSLFLTLAFPGFVYRYLLRRHD